jgi:uncharacterized protein YbaP (TraB family)
MAQAKNGRAKSNRAANNDKNSVANTPMLTTALFFLWCIVTSSATFSDPVWKVTHEQNTVYVAGTIHALTPADYPLPLSFETAYRNADILVLEADLAEMKTPEGQALLTKAMLYSDGKNLQNVLSPIVYNELTQFLQTRGGDINRVAQFKPGMLSALLTLDELKRLNQLGQGVDDFFDQRAQADKKTRLFLETIEQQLGFLARMGEGQEDRFILYSIRELDNLSSVMVQLKAAWRKGDNATLEKIGIKDWQDDFPAIYQDLLVRRNNAWIPQVEAMLNTQPTEAVLVGALHLVGKDGVLQQLRDRGYVVEQLHQ